MSTKRMRRFSATVNGSEVTGLRDLEIRDLSEFDNQKSDVENAGVEVRMTTGPYEVSFKAQADAGGLVTGYKSAFVATVKEVTIDEDTGNETVADRVYSLADGQMVKDLSVPTDSPGEVAIRGRFKEMTDPMA